MKRIDRIIVSACKDDYHLLIICVSSIRFYYPDIPIYLIKDYTKGDFNTQEIQQIYNVQIYETNYRYCGWGFSKLIPLIEIENERILILDSDTVFLGKVIELLEKNVNDVIVSGYIQNDKLEVKRSYFDLAELAVFDPTFQFTGLVFNTGQLVYNTKHFHKNEFEELGVVFESGTIRSVKTGIFGFSEQGIVNFLVLKKAQLNQIKMDSLDFMIWPPSCTDIIKDQHLIDGLKYPKIMHWAGPKDSIIQLMPHSGILNFFQNMHFQKLHAGNLKKIIRMLKRSKIRVILSYIRKTLLRQLS